MKLAALLGPAGTASGPITVAALGLLVAAAATAGDGEFALEASPFALASSGLLLLALLCVAATAVAAMARAADCGRGVAAPALAAIGTVLVAGGGWAAIFVLPALVAQAPGALAAGLSSVAVGYITSYVIFGVGWVATAISLLRARAVPVWLGVLTAAGGVLSLVPAPEVARLLVITTAASVLARWLSRGMEITAIPSTARA